MKSLWIVIILSALPSVIDSAVKKKSVITSLHAKWSQTSFIAEASEFMAQESDTLFWAYVDEIVEKLNVDEWHTYSDARQYELAIRLAGNLLEEARVNLLKFALSLRAHSPTVVLFQKLGAERDKSCTAFADVHGAIICDVNDLEKVIENGVRGSAPTVYSIDHVFPTTKEHNVTLIVYGELATASWRKFHLVAKALSRRGKDVRDDKLLLSGYGVELAIKSTEYKAVDDSNTVIDKITVEESSEEYTDNEEGNYGFNFTTLRKLHGDLKDSIEQFRLHLLERDELTPLKVWQVQELSYQAAQTVVLAGTQKALNVLIDSSQNFPLAARSLSRQLVRKEFISEVNTNQEQLIEYGVSEGESVFFINGIMVDVDALDVFQVLDMLKQEEKLANGFFRMGIKNEYLSMLMDLESSNEHISYAVDFRPAIPEYLNNLDTDKQYRQWANSVGLLLQPYFPGMLRPIARNFFTLIFVVDPSQKETRDLLQYALRFYAHEIPIRLGVVFVVNDEKEVSGFDDASVAMLNLYNFVKINDGIQKAMNILTEVKNCQVFFFFFDGLIPNPCFL
ncbi:unnamed protein product [Onchocerca flexuosa]|uniref:UDP-glucose:glycoprotein glucosyltransferase n=1 Tax=Onchocerca flexuosa TaxID=387005 RepID=A0A183I2F7_9BILA|nr:unnamed protein product [Onchocerca flexuosa]